MHDKVVIVTAPSGAGKTTIVKELLSHFKQLEFSVSACNRMPRPDEKNGKDYFFLTTEAFKNKIQHYEFVEWEEVYPGYFYGTLLSEIQRIHGDDKDVIFDVDVKGAVSLKNYFGKKSLSLFIKPPSEEILIERLRGRGTESEEKIKVRMERVRSELAYEHFFDKIIYNEDLEKAVAESKSTVSEFLSNK
jgi:guanylate kinase